MLRYPAKFTYTPEYRAASMAIQLRLESDSTELVASLHRWLRREPPVRTKGALSWAPSGDPEHQGILIDVLTLVVGSGLSAGQLWLALQSWRDSRPKPPTVIITHVAADGATTRIESSDQAAFLAAVRALEPGP
jgi:hypothetical protein